MSTGYNPNRDSGVAGMRSFIEVPASAIPSRINRRIS